MVPFFPLLCLESWVQFETRPPRLSFYLYLFISIYYYLSIYFQILHREIPGRQEWHPMILLAKQITNSQNAFYEHEVPSFTQYTTEKSHVHFIKENKILRVHELRSV